MRLLVRALLIAATTLIASTALADEAAQRSAALRAEGNQLMDERRFDDALARYQEALRLTPSDAAIYYNLSRVHELRGDAVSALENMERFVMAASAELKARVGNVDAITKELRSRVAFVHLECTAPPIAGTDADSRERALLLADDRVIGNGCSARDLRVKAGHARFRAEANGYVGRAIDMDLPGGLTTVVRLELAPRNTSGLLRLRSEPEHVTVMSDGVDLGSTPLEVVLAAGSHQLALSASGYDDLVLPVVVDANSSRDLPTVRLERTAPLTSRWWFWTGIGVAVAAGAGITYALVTERSPDRGTIEPGTTKLPLMRW